jgi:hypothetical protein
MSHNLHLYKMGASHAIHAYNNWYWGLADINNLPDIDLTPVKDFLTDPRDIEPFRQALDIFLQGYSTTFCALVRHDYQS